MEFPLAVPLLGGHVMVASKTFFGIISKPGGFRGWVEAMPSAFLELYHCFCWLLTCFHIVVFGGERGLKADVIPLS